MTYIGPQLPPHLLKQNDDNENHSKINDKDGGKSDGDDNEEKNVTKDYGPSLPPGFGKKVVGPALPPQLARPTDEESSRKEDGGDDDDDDDDGDIIGPCLPNQSESINDYEQIKTEFENRAKAMKNKLTGKGDDKKLERETWMLELPPELSKNFGMGPRSFRSKAPELGDRSVWTDTPADLEKKKNERREAAQSGEKRKANVVVPPSAEEIEMHERIEEYNKATRPQSLMEMHQEKRKKTEEPNVRLPFDRDRDLAINRSDPKEKAKFIKNAQGLNNKFSKGSYSDKFL